MSKFIKVCLITAGGCIMLGFLAVTIGIACGGKTSLYEIKRSGMGTFGFWNAGHGEEYTFEDWDENEGQNFSGKVDKMKVADASEIQELTCVIGMAALYIRESQDDNYYFESNTEGKVKCYQEAGELVIKGVRRRLEPLITNGDEIYLYIPASASLDSIDIKIGAGYVESVSQKAREISYKIGAGKAECLQLQADELEVEVGAGEFSVDAASVLDVELKAGAGKITMNGEIKNNLQANCAIGTIELDLEGSVEDHNYELKSALGEIRIGDMSYNGLVASKKIYSNNVTSNFDMNCGVGKMDIRFQN